MCVAETKGCVLSTTYSLFACAVFDKLYGKQNLCPVLYQTDDNHTFRGQINILPTVRAQPVRPNTVCLWLAGDLTPSAAKRALLLLDGLYVLVIECVCMGMSEWVI